MERTFAYRLINASKVLGLLPTGNISPANERVARPLTKLLPEPEVVPKAWSEAVDRAEVSSDGKPIITAKHIESIVTGECDENVCREDFTPSEAVAIAEAIEQEERKAAKERQGTRTDKHSDKLSPSPGGKSREKTAAKVGMSHATYTKAKAVVDGLDAIPDPEIRHPLPVTGFQSPSTTLLGIIPKLSPEKPCNTGPVSATLARGRYRAERLSEREPHETETALHPLRTG